MTKELEPLVSASRIQVITGCSYLPAKELQEYIEEQVNTRYKRTCHPVEKFNSISPWPVMVCSECGRPLHYDNIDVSRDDEDYEYAPFCVCGAEVADE